MKKTLIRGLLLIVLLLLAIVLGSVIGSAVQGVSFLSWLGMSTGFGPVSYTHLTLPTICSV